MPGTANQDVQLHGSQHSCTAAQAFENLDRGMQRTLSLALWRLVESRFNRRCWRQDLAPAMFHRDCAGLLAAQKGNSCPV